MISANYVASRVPPFQLATLYFLNGLHYFFQPDRTHYVASVLTETDKTEIRKRFVSVFVETPRKPQHINLAYHIGGLKDFLDIDSESALSLLNRNRFFLTHLFEPDETFVRIYRLLLSHLAEKLYQLHAYKTSQKRKPIRYLFKMMRDLHQEPLDVALNRISYDSPLSDCRTFTDKTMYLIRFADLNLFEMSPGISDFKAVQRPLSAIELFDNYKVMTKLRRKRVEGQLITSNATLFISGTASVFVLIHCF